MRLVGLLIWTDTYDLALCVAYLGGVTEGRRTGSVI